MYDENDSDSRHGVRYHPGLHAGMLGITSLTQKWSKKMAEYPYWIEYLCEIGVIPKFLWCETCFKEVYDAVRNTRIAPEIAQKLGIEPKNK